MVEVALTSHKPLLVNTVGHSLGALLFALSIYFLASRSTGSRIPRLPVFAASLALTWNVASLLVLAAREEGWSGLAMLVALSTSALSVLPAVLLHLSLGERSRSRWIVWTGYALSAAAVVMHATEHVLASHRAVLLMTMIGFAALTAAATVQLVRSRESTRDLTRRLLAAMAVFLFAVSLVHVDAGEAHEAWSMELLAHHAGVPLALVILLQDFRFVLLDAFVRVLAGILLAAFAMALASPWVHVPAAGNAFRHGLTLVAASVGLAIYAVSSVALQQFLMRALFGRNDLERTIARLREVCGAAKDEAELLRAGGAELATFLRAQLCATTVDLGTGRDEILFPRTVAELPGLAPRHTLEAAGVEVVVPLRLGPGDTRFLLLGRRSGGRRYLSEDLQAAERLGSQLVAHVEHFREAEMRQLVAQAELRALESQIHPHFLFNALNTLYGVIPREASGARRTVLNLADILRYFLRAERTYIPLEEELRIVEAYLEIEKLRLGDRLRTRIQVDEAVRRTPIPVLSLQPLVENAVKHAIATQAEGGEVVIRAHASSGKITVGVEDTGPGFGSSEVHGQGVAMQNVSRRLKLCYGANAELRISDRHPGSTVEFDIPVAGQVA